MLCQSFRNPALVAKMAATLQFLLGGCYILGIGAGWLEEEYLAYGYDFPAASIRVELGVDYFLLDCSGFPNLTTATMLVNEVLPALNG